MTTKAFALAGLCLPLGWWALAQTPVTQPPSDVFVTNQRSLSVPVNLQESRRAELRQLVLYSSNDQGRTWQQVSSMDPNQAAFNFTAPLDGHYWLKAAVINRQGKQEPDNLYQTAPDQKVTIDTMKPLLRLKTPQRQGDDVALAWELQEDNPEWSSFRLEYQGKDGGAWTPIQATPGLTGQARFRPTTQGPIAIRLSFRDQAGNQAFTLADISGTITTAAFTGQIDPPSASLPAPMFPSVPPAPQAPLPALPAAPGHTAASAAPPIPSTPEPTRLPGVGTEAPRTFPMNPPAAMTPWKESVSSPKVEEKVVASSVASAPIVPATTPITAAPRPLPPLQYVNHPEVTLEYELNRIGPSGVGSVELWWTQNDGQSWELYAIDPEAKSGTVNNGRHKREVPLPGDGVYGFTLIVKSKAGLGKPAPKAGDMPEMRVEVDTTAPVAQLFVPQPEAQKPNTLLLKWSAKDSNLTNTPIVLEWAAKREGPWHGIAQPLANSGKHSWALPDGLPVQVYLRLRVRDLAGNESVAVTQEPQLVDLSEPEGHLVNVSVSPR